MNTTASILSVDGVVLNTLAKNIESLTGRLTTPAKRTGNIQIPGRHGALHVSNKKYDISTIVLPMWVRGTDDDGYVNTTQPEEFYRNIDELTRLFSKSGLLDIRHTLPDGSIRQCFGEVLDVINFDTSSSSGQKPLGKFSVSIVLPYPFWQDLDVTTQFWLPGAGLSTALPLSSDFNRGTAVIEDGLITINGPCNNPGIDTGITYWEYDSVIAAGQSITVDSGNWALTSSGGLTVNARAFLHRGDSRWMVIPPGSGQELRFLCTGGANESTSVELTAHLKYMVG